MTQYLPPNRAGLDHIDHIVVLMLENRSFDNLLGWLYDDQPPPRGQEFEGLRRSMSCPLTNVDPDGIAFIEKVPVHRNGEPHRDRHGKPVPSPPDFRLPDPDPGEGFIDTNQQLFQRDRVPDLYAPIPTCQGWVDNYAGAMLYGTYAFGDPPADPRAIMTTYTPEQVPVLSTLAREFAVCDAWHCSVPSQTLPNRDFVHAATSNGQVNNQPHPICDAPTIFNRCTAENVPWRVYHGVQDNDRSFSLTRTIMSALHDRALDPNFMPFTQFAADAAAGKLPSYAFIEPQFSGSGQNDQHPNADIRPGDKLIADIYDALSNGPAWEKTLFVVTYDEHGGCFDHVPPPDGATAPDAKPGDKDNKFGAPGQMGFRFNRFGVRVPAVIVSPWIAPGTVARPQGYVPFDHTSVIATVTRRFGLKPLTYRDAAAPDLSCVLTLTQPRTDKPSVAPLEWDTPGHGRENDLQAIVADVLSHLNGTERPGEQQLDEYIHEAYQRRFGGGSQ